MRWQRECGIQRESAPLAFNHPEGRGEDSAKIAQPSFLPSTRVQDLISTYTMYSPDDGFIQPNISNLYLLCFPIKG
jgi:hypothetical protein